MYGHFIRKRHNPQVAAFQLWNLAPESVAIVRTEAACRVCVCTTPF